MWVAVDKDGDEYIYRYKPSRGNTIWSALNEETMKVTKGTVERLLNYPLTWDDDCQEIVEYKDSILKEDNKMIKQNIKMRVTPEQSKKVQEICFENGIYWIISGKEIKYTDKLFLEIEESLSCPGSEHLFNTSHSKEIDADLFIRTNGTCEDTTWDDDIQRNIVFAPNADEHLRQKIVNLHDQLNKNRKIVQNQKEELTRLLNQKKQLNNRLDIYALYNDNQKIKITNLLAQKEELQSQLNMANKTVVMSIDNDIELIRLLEEKDIIIKYLENRLEE